MITNLHIKNIGIIDDIEVDFNEGLNVLTGETGAGKSLIIKSLNIISGGRFSKDIIRKGETNSFIEICLYEPRNERAIDGNIIISREINLNGKNMCKINGRMVTVNELKDFMKNIIEIHGQNENLNLQDNKEHIKYLDGFIDLEIKNLKEEYGKYYNKLNEIKKELKENLGDDKERQRELDLLKYQLNEIDMSKLKEGEEESLEENQKIISNSEKISVVLNELEESIGENAIDLLSNSIRNIEKIENLDKKYVECANGLKSIYYEIQEITRDISNYKEDINYDEEELKNIDDRLGLIFSLKRKYGNSIKEILIYRDEIESKIKKIENLDDYIYNLKQEEDKIKERLNQLGIQIHNIREIKAQELSNEINQNLQDLEMKNAKINIHIDYIKEDFFENGKDKVEFFICTNLGEDEKELNKITSGGEMSRIMLAIKAVIAKTDSISNLIFDEIDTGISGKAANSVAEKLNKISKNHQILCISHLPAIAAMADYNYFINKNIINNRTTSSIKKLEGKEVLHEIARISSGKVNDVTLKYAEELCLKKLAC